jgi:hypothetical protein
MPETTHQEWKGYIQELIRRAHKLKWERLSEPLLEAYAALSSEERKGVEGALIGMLLDSDERIALDGAVLVNDLYRHGGPSADFGHRVVEALERIISRNTIKMTGSLAYELIGSLGTFQVRSAVPFLKQYINDLEKERMNGRLSEREYGSMMWISWSALARLSLQDAIPFFYLLLDHDRRLSAIQRIGSSGAMLAVFWREIGVKGVQKILSSLAQTDIDTRELAYTQLQLALNRLHQQSRSGIGTAPAPDEEDNILRIARQTLDPQ